MSTDKANSANGLESLTDKFADMLRGVYHCNRVWSAWRLGTMGERDFSPADESDLPGELAEAAIAMLAAAPQPPQAEAVSPDLAALADNLERFNVWRRGDEILPMPDPKDVGNWIDQAVAVLRTRAAPQPQPQPQERRPLTDELLAAVKSALVCSYADFDRRSVNQQAWERLVKAIAEFSTGSGEAA